MRKLLSRCPNCGGDLEITEVRCAACDTVIRSHYAPCEFCRLDEETLSFIKDFVRVRGNLREMARESGDSYWTLRARLNEVAHAMGFEEQQEEDSLAEKRREILLQVQQGGLAAAEAAAALAKLGGEEQ